VTRCQFHQRFMRSFYLRRFQKHKNDIQVIVHFALLGSMNVKAAHKHVGEIDSRSSQTVNIQIARAMFILLKADASFFANDTYI